MTKVEILEALKHLTTEERIKIIETASRLMREEIVGVKQCLTPTKHQFLASKFRFREVRVSRHCSFSSWLPICG
jgi:hypothetical protein